MTQDPSPTPLALPRTPRTARESQPGIWPDAPRRIHAALSDLLGESQPPRDASDFNDLILDMVSFAYGRHLAADGQQDRVDEPDQTDTLFTFQRPNGTPVRFQVIVLRLEGEQLPFDAPLPRDLPRGIVE